MRSPLNGSIVAQTSMGRSPRRMKHVQHDIEWYLSDPRARKWIAKCGTCDAASFAKGAPEKFFGRAQLERYFGVLVLDEAGRCPACERALR